jgi:hypothetical protein
VVVVFTSPAVDTQNTNSDLPEVQYRFGCAALPAMYHVSSIFSEARPFEVWRVGLPMTCLFTFTHNKQKIELRKYRPQTYQSLFRNLPSSHTLTISPPQPQPQHLDTILCNFVAIIDNTVDSFFSVFFNLKHTTQNHLTFAA